MYSPDCRVQCAAVSTALLLTMVPEQYPVELMTLTTPGKAVVLVTLKLEACGSPASKSSGFWQDIKKKLIATKAAKCVQELTYLITPPITNLGPPTLARANPCPTGCLRLESRG